MSLNDYLSYQVAQPRAAGEINNVERLIMTPPNHDLEDSSEEEITLDYIIEMKPKTKIVRKFFKYNMAAIKSEEQRLFEK